MKTTAIVLFILTYVLLLSLPKHRAKIAMATATIFVALGILPFSKVFTTVDLECDTNDCRNHGTGVTIY